MLNRGLQNCATQREKCDVDIENQLKKCNSMDAIRSVKDPNVKQGWME